MIAEYKVNRCSRRCAAEDRPLRDGEWFYSVVIDNGQDEQDLIRRDYSAGAWTEPPPGTIGWWKSRMPESGQRKMVLAADPVLVDSLRQMEHDELRRPLAYLLALTLLRRRIVRLVTPAESEPRLRMAGSPGSNEVPTRLRFQVLSDGSEIEIEECTITRRQTESLAEALQELLYCEAAE